MKVGYGRSGGMFMIFSAILQSLSFLVDGYVIWIGELYL